MRTCAELFKGAGAPAAPSSSPAVVHNFEYRISARAKAVPAGFTAIEDIVADSESNPRKRAALERARAKISARLKKADGETIKSARLSHGLSQSSLAEILETSQSHVARIERGSENLSWETMRKLSQALKVDMNRLDEMLARQRCAYESSQS